MSKVKKALIPALLATLVLALTGAFVSMKPLQASAQNQGNMQITLTDGIIVKYYAELAQGTQSATAVFDSAVDSLDDTVTGENTEGNTWEFIYTKVTPQYVDQTFNITVNGTSMVSDYSVADYLASVIAKGDAKAEEKTLAQDLVYYGQAAKAYKLGGEVTATQGTVYAGVKGNLDLTGTYSGANNRIEKATVVFDNVPAIKFYFAKASQDAVVKVDTVDVTDQLTQEKGLYVYTQTGIYATDFDKKYTVTFTNGTYEQTLNYSVNDYATRTAVSTKVEVTDEMKMLAKALWSYGAGAEALWTANNNTENPNPGEGGEGGGEVTLLSIALKDGTKTDYAVGETVEGTLVATYDDDTTQEIPLTEDMLTGFDTSSVGDRKVTVNYENLTTSFKLRVAYNLAAITDVRSGAYVVQVEDTNYVNTSRVYTGSKSPSPIVTDSTVGGEAINASNNATAYRANAVGVRFYIEQAGAYHLGMRVKGVWGNKIENLIGMYVNGIKTSITSVAIANNTMATLANISGTIYLNAGVNEFVFEQVQSTTFPAVDYFTVTGEKYFGEDVTLEVSGNATVNLGGTYKDGLTLTVKESGATVATVPVNASMISGLDTSNTGDCPVIISYLGAKTTANIAVVDQTHTVTLANGTFEGGATTATLKYGDTLPAITWNVTKVLGYLVNNEAYADISNLKITEDTTIKAYEGASAAFLNFAYDASQMIAYNSGMNQEQWNYGTPKSTTATNIRQSVPANTDKNGNYTGISSSQFNTNDTFKYANYTAGALSKGFTHIHTYNANSNLNNKQCAVFVTFTNNLDVTLKDVYFSTQTGVVYLGDVGAGETVRGGVVAYFATRRTTHIFWSNEDITAPDFTISVHLAAV